MVKTGEMLGQVGMSCLSNFPHLHLSVSKNGKTVDPFLTEQAQSQLFRVFGKRRPKMGWSSGDYCGVVTLWRNNRILAVRQTGLTVTL
jgi:murein DD-endopeptidase MepM/ murein hydrolase activator NlpD